MSYGVRYILSLLSDRGNDIRIEILEKGFSGTPEQKSLGSAPSLVVEEADGGIKGSSIAMAIQADVEGELKNLYTTDNRKFRVDLYRNSALYWQGYLMPELYSENYVDPPFDISVTASDQLGALKNISYKGDNVNVSLLEVVENILARTSLDLPFKLHLQIAQAPGTQPSLLRTAYVNAATFNGYNCYDALNAVLLSCNCTIMQLGCSWLIASKTDATTVYDVDGQMVQQDHCVIDSMHKGDVWPSGSLNMVNVPAVKGVEINYRHILRNSFLNNAECSSKDGWLYTITDGLDLEYPMEFQAYSKIYKAYAWRVSQKDVQKDWALQVWQDVYLEEDALTVYKVSVDHLFGPFANTLLLAIVHVGNDGITRRLTAEGWVSNVLASDPINYIQITGEGGKNQLTAFDVANKSLYTTSSVTFTLPSVAGTLRIGFINTTTEGAAPVNGGEIYFSNVFFTVDNITGKTSTTLVQENATVAQQSVELSYGDPAQGPNAHGIVLNTLTDAQGEQINYWYLQSRQYLSYYALMEQEWSRYYGTKKMQLQGVLMGGDVLCPYYTDAFSGRVFRLCQGDYNLLSDEISVTLEEVITDIVSYQTIAYATDNTSGQGGTSGGGATVAGGGMSDSYLQLQSDGDVHVKNSRPLTGFEARFDQLALPKDVPAKPKEGEVYIYNKEASAEEEWNDNHINIQAIIAKVKRLESMWFVDKNNEDTIRTTWNIIVEKAVTFGQGKKEVADNGGSGGNSGNGAGITAFSIIVNGAEYKLQNGVITLPNYPIVPKSLPNPYALKINNVVYDGSAPQEITIEAKDVDLTGYATEDWVSQQGFLKQIDREGVVNALEYVPQKEITEGNKLPYSLISGTPTSLENPYSLTIKVGNSTVQYDGSATKSITITAASLGALTEHQDISHLLSKKEAESTYQLAGDYITIQEFNSELNNRNYITAERVSDTYATKAQLNNTNNNLLDLQDAHDTLRSKFDALDNLLNSDVSGKINTWQEVVNFLDEYSGSQDLAAILSGINADIAKRALQTNLDSAVVRISILETKVSTLDDIFGVDASGNVYVKKKANGTARDFYTYGAISFGGYGESSGSGNGGITSVTYDMVVDALGYTPYNSANFTKANIKSTLGISDWALAASKPTYTKTDVGLGNVQNTAVYTRELGVNGTNWTFASTYYTADGKSTSIYAPTSAGTAGQYLVSNGSGAPYWYTINPYDANTSRTANTVLAAPNGSNGSATFRKLVAADMPDLSSTYLPLVGGTIAGNLRLKGSGNYGNYLYFGDGSYAYIAELSDDELTIKADAINVNGTANFSNGLKVGSFSINEALSGTATYLTVDGMFSSNSHIMTKKQFRVYQYDDSNTLQGGLRMFIASNGNANIDFSSVSESASLRNKRLDIVNYTGGDVVVGKADSWGSSVTAFLVLEGSFVATASNDKSFRYLVGGDNGYFEAAGMNLAITSRESSYTAMTGVTFDWLKSSDTLELNKVYYSGGIAKTSLNLRVNGNIIATGAITFGSASDRRLKDNIQSLSYEQAISVVMGLNPVTFKWNTTANELGKLSGISDGFIADEYEALIPNSGRSIWANYRAIDYTRAIPYVAVVVKNHETRLEAAEREIKELKNELKQYRRA